MTVSKSVRTVQFTDDEAEVLIKASVLLKKIYEEMSCDEYIFDGYSYVDLDAFANGLKEAGQNRLLTLVAE